MGGCKGCHGVAQTSFGTDFSFLLDFAPASRSLTPTPFSTIRTNRSQAPSAFFEYLRLSLNQFGHPRAPTAQEVKSVRVKITPAPPKGGHRKF
jgi:hypothetical protein